MARGSFKRLDRQVLLRAIWWVMFAGAALTYARLAAETGSFDDKDWSHLWLGGRMVASGHGDELYDPLLQVEVYRQSDPQGRAPEVWNEPHRLFGCVYYPPPMAAAYALLAWMPMRQAAVWNACLTLALALAVAWLVARTSGGRVPYAAAGAAILLYPPFFVNFALGQNGVLTMAVVLVGWHLMSKNRDGWAGLALGLLICKPNWFLAIGWIPLIHGRWPVLLGMAGGAVLISAAATAWVGFAPFGDYVAVLRKVANLHELPDYALSMKYDGLGVFRKWFGVGTTSSLLGWGSCVVLGLATWKATRGFWRPGHDVFHQAMACCLTASLWVNPHLSHYDMVLLAPCILIPFANWPDLGRSDRWAVLAIALFCYVALPWDRSWSGYRVFPVPSVALIVLWGWFVHRLARCRRPS